MRLCPNTDRRPERQVEWWGEGGGERSITNLFPSFCLYAHYHLSKDAKKVKEIVKYCKKCLMCFKVVVWLKTKVNVASSKEETKTSHVCGAVRRLQPSSHEHVKPKEMSDSCHVFHLLSFESPHHLLQWQNSTNCRSCSITRPAQGGGGGWRQHFSQSIFS